MQVLLRRTPPAKLFPSLAAYYTKKSSHFVGIKNNIRNPKNQTCTFFSPCSPPPSMATIAGSIPMKQRLRFTATVPSRFYSTNCRICRCALSKGRVGRSWVGLKEGRTGSGTVWCHTASGGVGLKRSDEFGLLTDGESVKKSGRGLSSGEVGVEDRQGSEKGVSLVSGTVEKPVRLNRRHKSSPVAAAPPENPDLLKIPGVGPRNLRKLVEKGIEEVAQLKKLYRDKFFGKSNQKMVEYLQSSVGIIHRNHAESITSFIRKSVDDEVKDSSNSGEKPAQKKRLTFCVEGNISVGKSTFLQRIANETLELRDLVEIVPEPINKWQDVGPDHFNVLDAFYTEPQRYAYTFQNYVFVTRVMQERESSGGIKPLRLMERSVFSDRMVFVRAVHEANWMNEMEISIYDSWFDPVVSTLPGLIPDGFIYLRASPDTCHKRMMLRKRSEEGGVSLDYLRGLHEKHENWLFPFESGNHGILSISKLPIHLDSSLHPDIRDRVFYLEGEHMHSSIQKVPALVLDCEPNIDFNRDIEAKRQYARQVAEFFEFVKKKNEAAPLGADKGAAAKGNLSQVMLPHKGLWVPPEGFPESALKSMNFRGAMSYTSG